MSAGLTPRGLRPTTLELSREDFLVRCARVLFYAGLFTVSLLVFRVGGITVGDILLMLSSAVLVLGPRENVANPILISPRVAIVGGLLLVGGALSTAVSASPLESAMTMFRMLYVALVLPWQARRLLSTTRRLSSGFTVYASGAALCGLGALAQFRFGYGIIPGSQLTEAGRYSGFTENVSDTGGTLCLAVVIGVAGIGKGTSSKTKLISVALLMGGLVGLMLSGSVSGMLSAAAGCCVVLLLRGVSLFRLALIAGVGAAAAYLGNVIIQSTKNALSPLERFSQTIGLTGYSSLNTTASRLETDRLGWESFIRHPLTGVGLDTKAAVVDPIQNLAVHNFVLGALHQGGLIFTLGILIAVVASVASGFRRVAHDGLAIRACGSAVAAMVFAMTAPSFFNRYFWVPMAFLVVYSVLREKEKANTLPV